MASRPLKDQDNEHWVSMSDLMAGLMMVFMFISIAYMHYVRIEKEKIKEVAVAYENAQLQLYNALETEFTKDLPAWDAEIDKQTLEVRFKSPDVLFGLGSTELKPKFKQILDNFFPRYLKVLDNYQNILLKYVLRDIQVLTGMERPILTWPILITWNSRKGEHEQYCSMSMV